MRAEVLLNAIGELDGELLYDAQIMRHARPNGIKRYAYAAAAVLVLCVIAVLYGVFVMPVSSLRLESAECASLSVNSRGRVMSIRPDTPSYQRLVGNSADTAVAAITGSMLHSGSLNEDENTLLISVSGAIDPTEVTESVQSAMDSDGFIGCILTVFADDGRDYLIDLLADEGGFSRDSLADLSVNDLNLLICDRGIKDDLISVSARPGESKYIGAARAKRTALEAFSGDSAHLSEINVAYTVWHKQLAYLVTFKAGDRGEAYFIHAETGAITHRLSAGYEELSPAVDRAVGHSADIPVTQPPSLVSVAAPFEQDSISESAPVETVPETAPNTEEPAVADERYTAIALSMKELTFVSLRLPDDVRRVGYRTAFEGQCIEARNGEKMNEGELAVITSAEQLSAFLKTHDHAYINSDSCLFENTYTDLFFEKNYLIVSACVFSDAGYYTTIGSLDCDDSGLYADVALRYGAAYQGEYYCYALSVYEAERDQLSNALSVVAY